MNNPSLAAARDAYFQIVDALRQRTRGLLVAGSPDWVDPSAVESVSLDLPSASCRPAHLVVCLREGIPGSVLPKAIRSRGINALVPLRSSRSARAIAQGAPTLTRQVAPCIEGTATCIVMDKLAPSRNYLMTCGHVVAPDAAACVNQTLDIAGEAQVQSGKLVDWQPSIGVDVWRTTIDAGLVEVTADDAVALRRIAGFIPASMGLSPIADMQVSLRRKDAPITGSLKVSWSGYVDLPGITPGFPDYFLADAIGYLAAEPTRAGDSGGAIWDTADGLMGMHIGGLPDTGPGNPNAVFGPIQPALEWFSVQPYLRRGGVSSPTSAGSSEVSARQPTPTFGAAGPQADEEVSVVAATLWGEARNQGEQGMRAVACVINNRLKTRYRGKTTATAVCLDPKQFSCWNAADPNLPRMRTIATHPDSQYFTACSIARELVQGNLQDITNGARHYYAASLRPPAYWSKGKTPCKVIGDHLFFNDID